MAQKEIDISIGLDALIENGFFYLEEHQWKRAKEYFDKASEIGPRNPYPYLGRLLVTHKLPTMDSLPDCPVDFQNSNNFKTALRYADESLNAKLQGYIEQYQVKFDEKYQAACMQLSHAESLKDYEKCYQLFIDFGDYKDAAERANKAKEFITHFEYDSCVEKMKRDLTENEYEKLYGILSNMNYKDSAELASQCRRKYVTLKYQREEKSRNMKTYDLAKAKMQNAKSAQDYIEARELLSSIVGYQDSPQLIEQCDAEIERRKSSLFFNNLWNNNTAMIAISVIIFIISLLILRGNMLMFAIVTEIIFVGFGIAFTKNEGCIGKGIFIGLVSGLIFGVLLGLLAGNDSSSSGGPCTMCGGDGIFFNKICGACGGWGTE